MVRAWSLILMLFGLGSLANAFQEKVASVEGVTEYRFENGARLVLFPDDSRPTITVNMTVLVGSRHEGYGESGMAHLLEHMVFKGTPTFPDIPKALKNHGASFNGTTNVDRTNYFETLPANDENLDFAIHLECDRLVNSYVRREDLMSEFSVVRNEFERGENSPSSVLSQRVEAVAYEWHNYGKSTIGNRSDIERVPIDNLQDFYKNYYQPDNVVLIVTGKFEESKALVLAKKYLGSIAKPTRRLNKTYTEEPPQDGERNVVLRRVDKVGAIYVVYHIPASSHPDFPALSILASVLSEDKIGRLERALTETKIATRVGAFANSNHDPGLFSISCQPAEGKLELATPLLLDVMENLSSQAFTADEIERAKTRAKRNNENTLSDARSMSNALSSAAALGDWRLWFIQRDRIAAVTADDVNRVAQTYFKRQNRTVGTFIPVDAPERLSVPAVESIAELVNNYKGGSAVESGEAFDSSPENLQQRTTYADIGGLRVGLLPKKNRGNTVSLSMTLRYGNEESLRGLSAAAGMLPGMLMAGTQKNDRQALQQKMDALGVRVGTGGGGGRRGGGGGGRGGGGRGQAGTLSFSIDAKRDSLTPAIEIMAEILRQPAFPANEFERMKAGALTMTTQMVTDPGMLANNFLARALSAYAKGDVRYAQNPEESIEELTAVQLDQVKAIYEKQLSSAKGEIAIVGDFQPDAALEALRVALKDWSTETPYAQIVREVNSKATGGTETIVTPDKASATFLAGLSFDLTDEHADAAALQLGNTILGGDTLSSRLGKRIRQKEGLTYGASSSIAVPSRGNDARFTITVTCKPENMAAVEKAAMEELLRFLEEGPTESELQESKVGLLESFKIGRSSDGAIAGQIQSNLNLGRDFGYIAKREKMIERLSPQDVRDAFRRYVQPSRLVVIRAGDF